MSDQVCMWEILVPTEKRIKPHHMADPKAGFYTTRYHRVWDEKVRAIAGGLTIMSPSKGQWKAPCGTLFLERMIPVRIMATREQIEEIVEMTIQYYDQLAVLCYKLSDEVILKYANQPVVKRADVKLRAELKAQDARHEERARELYAKWVDRMDFHSNRMPGWNELTNWDKKKWLQAARDEDPNAFTISGGVKIYDSDDLQ